MIGERHQEMVGVFLPLVFDAKIIYYDCKRDRSGTCFHRLRVYGSSKYPFFATRDLSSLFARIQAAGKPYIPFWMHM